MIRSSPIILIIQLSHYHSASNYYNKNLLDGLTLNTNKQPKICYDQVFPLADEVSIGSCEIHRMKEKHVAVDNICYDENFVALVQLKFTAVSRVPLF